MKENKVILTYKRRRSSSQCDHHEIAGRTTQSKDSKPLSQPSPKRRIVTSLNQMPKSETLRKKIRIDENTSKYSICYGGGNLVVCDNCSRSYNLQHSDPPVKDISKVKNICNTCMEQNDTVGHIQQEVTDCKKQTTGRNVKGLDLGPMKLRSCKVLQMCNNKRKPQNDVSHGETSHTENRSDSIEKNSSQASFGLHHHQAMSLNEDSESRLPDLNSTEIPTPLHLDISTKAESNAGIQDECIVISGKSNSSQKIKTEPSQCDRLQKDHGMDNSVQPFAFFYKRTRKRKTAARMDVQNNLIVDRIGDSVHACTEPASDLRSKNEVNGKCNTMDRLIEAVTVQEKSLVDENDPKTFPMGTEESKDVLKNVDWKTLGNAVTNKTSGAVPKKRFSETRFRQIPEYYFLPKRSVPYVIGVYGTIIAAGIGAGMVIENWINKKIQEDDGIVWEFGKK